VENIWPKPYSFAADRDMVFAPALGQAQIAPRLGRGLQNSKSALPISYFLELNL
jgi:hypothetical protein